MMWAMTALMARKGRQRALAAGPFTAPRAEGGNDF
ncbi:hypothetical protein Mycsm_01837 [Mycobacterium sp. JS623]|nr:hypothetical protein Mycsm_01837 [Mycobacterium sp. JS623]